MKAPFTKYLVAGRGDAGMWQVSVWVKLRGPARNPGWFDKEMVKLTNCKRFIEDAIREKLERERP